MGRGELELRGLWPRDQGRSPFKFLTARCYRTHRDSAIVELPYALPLHSEIEERDPGGIERAIAHAESVIRDQFGDGPVEGKIAGFVISAS